MERSAGLIGCLGAFMMIQGCESSEPLPQGCYYGMDGGPFLKVQGRRAHFLIPGEIREVELTLASGWRGRYVRARPSFFLSTPRYFEKDGTFHVAEPQFIERNDLRSSRLPIMKDDPITIGILHAPDSYFPVELGKQC